MSKSRSPRVGEHVSQAHEPVPSTKTRRTIHLKNTLPQKMKRSHPCFFLIKQVGEVFDIDGDFSWELYQALLDADK
jgi:hypothetical protein